jgi:hypothetical protein
MHVSQELCRCRSLRVRHTLERPSDALCLLISSLICSAKHPLCTGSASLLTNRTGLLQKTHGTVVRRFP